MRHVLVLAALAAGQAGARDVHSVHMLQDPAVRKELKIGPEVAKRIDAIVEAYDSAEKDAITAAAERNEPQPDRESLTATLEGQSLRQARKLLTPEQNRRAQELYVRLFGAQVLTHPEVVARLNLDPDQVEAVGAIYASIRTPPLADGPGTLDGRLKARAEAMAAAYASADREALRLPTRRQRAKYEAMKGEPRKP
jgi:hypothetical protein